MEDVFRSDAITAARRSEASGPVAPLDEQERVDAGMEHAIAALVMEPLGGRHA